MECNGREHSTARFQAAFAAVCTSAVSMLRPHALTSLAVNFITETDTRPFVFISTFEHVAYHFTQRFKYIHRYIIH
jgi:hypothetical protein